MTHEVQPTGADEPGRGPDPAERTFLLVDLAGFTATTEAHGDVAAADLAQQLVELALAAAGPGDELVKSIGDAVLCASADPTGGVAMARAMFDAAHTIPDLPLLRAGLHHGPAVRRGSDWFGGAVNLTARVADLAAGGQVLATTEVAEAARALDVGVTDLGAFELRNLTEPVAVFELALACRGHGHAIDPVCRMRVERDDAVGRIRHQGTEHWFCSLGCVERFAADPDRYLP